MAGANIETPESK
jgi:hypothetical protein